MLASLAVICAAAAVNSDLRPNTDIAAPGSPARPSPAFIDWDPVEAGASPEASGTLWLPVMSAGQPEPRDAEFRAMVKGIKAQELIDCANEPVVIRSQGVGDGGIAGTSGFIFTLASVPPDVVMPVIQATQLVANYLESVFGTSTTINIKIQFQNLAGSTIAVASPRLVAQDVSPTLASLIASGSSGDNLDDARFFSDPPAPYGTGPVINSRWRTYYSNLQANGKNRYISENRLFWTAANLRAAWIYALPSLSALDGSITFSSAAGVLDNYVWDPSVVPFPPQGISYQDWLIRLTLVNMGWLSSIQTSLTSDSCILDMYRFRNDILAENTNGSAPASPPTSFGYLTQEPDAWQSIFGGLDCGDVSATLATTVNNGGAFTDPNLGLFAPDYNPGGYRKFRTVLALNSPFPDTDAQAAFVSSNFGTPLPGFSQYGTAIRNQFGGSGIFDDQQLVPLPPLVQRTRYLDYTMPSYVTESGYCFLIDYNPTFPGYSARFVVRGLNLSAGEVILNFVTGLGGSTTDDSIDGVDYELPLLDDTNASAGFLDAVVIMGQAVIPQGTTFFPNYLTAEEMKVMDSIGWNVP